jgi:tRNA (cmo5U34)-methyltransferase
MNECDQIYKTSANCVEDFVFDERVAHVFTDMINRSVPGYSLILEMLGVITQNFAQPETNCYDLGCSLGASTLAMRFRLDKMTRQTGATYSVVAVDTSAAMIDRCKVNLSRVPSQTSTTIACQRLQDTPIDNASLVVLNFTLQFLPLTDRLETLTRIARGMIKGGALILSEKVSSKNNSTDELMTELHHGFKRARGYSALEISRKRAALENVLLPESVSNHKDRLQSAGFNCAEVWFQCFNFVSLLAIK